MQLAQLMCGKNGGLFPEGARGLRDNISEAQLSLIELASLKVEEASSSASSSEISRMNDSTRARALHLAAILIAQYESKISADVSQFPNVSRRVFCELKCSFFCRCFKGGQILFLMCWKEVEIMQILDLI